MKGRLVGFLKLDGSVELKWVVKNHCSTDMKKPCNRDMLNTTREKLNEIFPGYVKMKKRKLQNK